MRLWKKVKSDNSSVVQGSDLHSTSIVAMLPHTGRMQLETRTESEKSRGSRQHASAASATLDREGPAWPALLKL